MTKILVTGATGAIGREVVRALRSKGLAVRAGARSPERVADLEALGAEITPLDLTDPASAKAAFDGVDRVFLLTPFVEHFAPMVDAGVAAARDAGVQFILRLSALGADPDSEEPLTREHGRAERKVADSGIAWSVIQATFLQDNLLTYGGESVRGQDAFYGASSGGKVSYVSAADVGAVAAEILADPEGHGSQTYVLTGPEAVDDGEVARLASSAAGRPIQYVDLSPDQLAEGLRSQQTPGWMVNHIIALEGIKSAGWAAQVSPAVQEILGRRGESYASFLDRNRSRLTA